MDKSQEELINQVMRDQHTMETSRKTWEEHWEEVAERCLPRASGFRKKKQDGAKRAEKAIDSTPILALERFAAAVESVVTPRTQTWHGLQNERFAEDNEVQEYFEECTRILFRVRYAPAANFANQMSENYVSQGAFGNGCIFVDELPGKGTRYICYPLQEIYFEENYQGIVDLVHRRFTLTARQAVQQFGKDALPDNIQRAAENAPMERYDFLHRVGPNDNVRYVNGEPAPGPDGMPWTSLYISISGKKIVRQGGYHTMPYCIGRYYKSPGETYGRGPGMTALPDIKVLNEMNKETLIGAQLANRPPVLVADDGALDAFSLVPGSINSGAVSAQGSPLAIPFNTGAQPQLGMEMMEQKRQLINDVFLVTLFQILVQNSEMTATEAMLRAQEKGQLLAPTMGRIMSEQLGPMIEREVDICARMGLFPQPPQQLIDAGAEFDIEYKSPLIRMQRADEGTGIAQTLQVAASIAQSKPDIMGLFKMGDILRDFADINGMPRSLIMDKEEEEQMQAQQIQQQQLQNVLQSAQPLAQAADSLASAQQKFNSPLPAPQ
ncbi:portal protein [Erwinia phyllosphaerae]|uniref:portal protein n=1 Tax=Erwinia phyllosphaerae TaxID=2853256 RepID=UPI001FEE93CE|nr:portal protein [Erwinia phyllosphaerae]MBV4365914.1 head-tail connector protein [Erwinia phyllosphaerae]